MTTFSFYEKMTVWKDGRRIALSSCLTDPFPQQGRCWLIPYLPFASMSSSANSSRVSILCCCFFQLAILSTPPCVLAYLLCFASIQVNSIQKRGDRAYITYTYFEVLNANTYIPIIQPSNPLLPTRQSTCMYDNSSGSYREPTCWWSPS